MSNHIVSRSFLKETGIYSGDVMSVDDMAAGDDVPSQVESVREGRTRRVGANFFRTEVVHSGHGAWQEDIKYTKEWKHISSIW